MYREQPAATVNEGTELWWFSGALVTVRVGSASTGGALGVVEVWEPRGSAAPLHLHPNTDETCLVLEGEYKVTAGAETRILETGGSIFIPRGTPHTHEPASAESRVLVMFTPGGFERYFVELGRPATNHSLGEPFAPDPIRRAEVAARLGYAAVGPEQRT